MSKYYLEDTSNDVPVLLCFKNESVADAYIALCEEQGSGTVYPNCGWTEPVDVVGYDENEVDAMHVITLQDIEQARSEEENGADGLCNNYCVEGSDEDEDDWLMES